LVVLTIIRAGPDYEKKLHRAVGSKRRAAAATYLLEQTLEAMRRVSLPEPTDLGTPPLG